MKFLFTTGFLLGSSAEGASDYLSELVKAGGLKEIMAKKEHRDHKKHLKELCKRQIERQNFPIDCFELRKTLENHDEVGELVGFIYKNQVISLQCEEELSKQSDEILVLDSEKWLSEDCRKQIQRHNRIVRYKRVNT